MDDEARRLCYHELRVAHFSFSFSGLYSTTDGRSTFMLELLRKLFGTTAASLFSATESRLFSTTAMHFCSRLSKVARQLLLQLLCSSNNFVLELFDNI